MDAVSEEFRLWHHRTLAAGGFRVIYEALIGLISDHTIYSYLNVPNE